MRWCERAWLCQSAVKVRSQSTTLTSSRKPIQCFFQKVIQKYQQEVEEDWGVLRFEIAKPPSGSRGGRPERYALLTEQQANLLLTYSKNTPQARLCKRKLVKAFEEAKKLIKEIIPAQTIEIEKLRLENDKLRLQVELAKAQQGAAAAQKQLMASCQTLALINPALPALVMGKSDALPPEKVVVEKTVLVDSRSKKPVAIHEGISKTKLSKRYGMRKPQDLVNWLKSIGKEDVLESGLIAAPCQYVRWEKVQELDQLWSSSRGVRQKLLGE